MGRAWHGGHIVSSAQLLLLYSAWTDVVGADDHDAGCIAFRRTGDCSPAGPRDPTVDASCDVVVLGDWAGFCECAGGFTTSAVQCGHAEFTCRDKCTAQARARGGGGSGAAGSSGVSDSGAAASTDADAGAGGGNARSVADADSELEQLYRRGKRFYVMGNIDLAIRHYREALRLDPDHKDAKAEHKVLKKLQKAMTEAEASLPQDVEGGRRVQLEQRENAERALKFIEDALAVSPPAVYRAELYRHLCKCHAALKAAEDALKSCAEFKSLDGGGLTARLYMAEAHVLSDQLDLAVDEYRAILEVEQGHRQAREGIDRVQKLKRRAKQVDHYKVLNVSRSSTEREIKRAYHKLAVLYHPDKYAAKDDKDAQEADRKFKEVARAYEVLGDEELRRIYDNGEDPDEQKQGGGGHGPGDMFRHMRHGERVHVHFG